MPEIFDFSGLFQDWETTFERIPKGAGHYDYANGGKWTPDYGQPVEMQGVIVPLSNDDLRFEPGGTYTRQDRKIYVQKPGELAIDDRVRYKGNEYRVLEDRPYEEYADFNIYIAKRVDTKGRDPVAEPASAP